MNRDTVIILGVVALAGAATWYFYQRAKAAETAASVAAPASANNVTFAQQLQNTGAQAVQNWFDQLWGSNSTGGTPEATTGN